LIFIWTITSAQKNNFFPDTTGVCSSDSVFLTLTSNLDKKLKITWITPKNIEYNTKRINAGKYPGKYIVQINDNGKIIKDSTIVLYVNKPVFNIRDTTVCKGVTLIADPKNTTWRYNWSTGDNSQRLQPITKVVFIQIHSEWL
jgi:hypothetical protein